MEQQAATPSGGAEGAPAPSIHERIKAIASPQPEQHAEPASEGANPSDNALTEPVAESQAPEPAAQAAETEATESESDAQTLAQLSSLTELADATGLELDKLMDLDIATKIDGKEGKARLRDLIKSYQLEGHLTQKSMALAEERKAFEAEAQRKVAEYRDRVTQLSQAVGLAQRILDGEYAGIDWAELQRTDPLKFQSEYGAYKMRLDGIQGLAQQIAQENERAQAQQQAEYKAYLAEEMKQLDMKVPEWSDKSVRDKQITEMASALSEAYGVSEQELRSIVDHRQILIARDAAKWQALQKSKPAVVNKVKAAPKLVKPGTTKGSAEIAAARIAAERAQVRKTGSTQDAARLLKSIGLARVN